MNKMPRIALLMATLLLPAAAQALDFTYTTNGCCQITITGYTGTNKVVTIPDTINGLPVTSIGAQAFYWRTGVTSVTIPNSVTKIRNSAFDTCANLTNVVFGNGVASIGDRAFALCKLGSISIPNSVTSIGVEAFEGCTNLTSVTIGNSVTSIGDYAFSYCYSLTSVYFKGNAPTLGGDVFYNDNNATIYYLPGTTGWTNPWGGRPTVCWNPTAQNMGAASGAFGFNITGSSNLVIVVEACTDLANPVWVPVSTNTLTGGVSFFSDPAWTNYPARFYRFRPL